MFANGVSELIQESIKLELEKIRKDWGKTYNSAHEGYAVLLEEVEEVDEAIGYLKTDLKMLWERIKNDFQSVENIDKGAELLMIVMNAKEAAQELVQVAAVAEKFVQTLNGEEEELMKNGISSVNG